METSIRVADLDREKLTPALISLMALTAFDVRAEDRSFEQQAG